VKCKSLLYYHCSHRHYLCDQYFSEILGYQESHQCI